MTRLADLAWPEVRARADAGAVLVVPVASTEQHGPHLPLSTDTDIALAVTTRLAELRPEVLIAPVIAYGSSGEHAGFAGTLSIGQEALELLLVELCRSATDTFSRLVLVSSHGGNAETVRRAQHRMRAESRDVLAWFANWDGDAHAGRTETSIQLTLSPRRVFLDRAEAGDRRPIAELLPALMTGGIKAVSANGVLGDPEGASPAEGEQLLQRLVADLDATVRRWLHPVRL
jgi:creatinine amidohydrolase